MPESPSEFYLQRHLVRDFLLDLHQFHAPRDIATPKFPITKSLKEKPPPAELRTYVEDFLQPKNLTRRRVTGYSPGHIRSLLDLDTFGPNHSQKVEAKRSSGILPMSPNMSRFGTATGGSRRLSNISESGASRAQSAAASMFRPSVKFTEECTPPSMLAKLDLPDDESEGSAGLKSMAISTAKSTAAFSKSAVEIAEMDDDIRKSNPTYKRLQYAKTQKKKEEVICEVIVFKLACCALTVMHLQRKVQRKEEKRKKKKLAARLRAEIHDYQSSLSDFEKNILKGYDTKA